MFALLTKLLSQLAFTCSKSTTETVGQFIRYVPGNRTTVIEQCQLMSLWCLSSYFWTDSTPYAKVFAIDFEHVIAGLVCMVCETQNLLTLQYTVHLKIPFSRNSYHTETSHLQCISNQLNGFNRHSKFNPTRAGFFWY